MSKRIVIIAGEESGDIHAASLVKSLLSLHPELIITGIGGHHMEAAGVELVYDLARYGVTGLTEIVRHAFIIRKAFIAIKNHLQTTPPDLLILVDYPGFNLRLASYAKKKLGLRIFYYISPQIWAWKANRINTIKNCIDHMAVILPFEKVIYEKAGVPVSFVGHPLVEQTPSSPSIPLLRQQLNLPLEKQLIAFLPGSRNNEIEKHLPILVETAKQLLNRLENIHFVIPVAYSLSMSNVKDYFNHTHLPITFIAGQAIDVAACSDCVVVASGTASLECALLAKPMCIIYKASVLTFIAATQVIKVKYMGLSNLLTNKMIVPELLQYDFNADELTKMVYELLTNQSFKKQMINNLDQLKTSLSQANADLNLTQLIEKELCLTN